MLAKISLGILLTGLSLYAYVHDTINPLKGDIRVHDPMMIKDGRHLFCVSYRNY